MTVEVIRNTENMLDDDISIRCTGEEYALILSGLIHYIDPDPGTAEKIKNMMHERKLNITDRRNSKNALCAD